MISSIGSGSGLFILTIVCECVTLAEKTDSCCSIVGPLSRNACASTSWDCVPYLFSSSSCNSLRWASTATRSLAGSGCVAITSLIRRIIRDLVTIMSARFDFSSSTVMSLIVLMASSPSLSQRLNWYGVIPISSQASFCVLPWLISTNTWMALFISVACVRLLSDGIACILSYVWRCYGTQD